jgi:hypothetical protein
MAFKKTHKTFVLSLTVLIILFGSCFFLAQAIAKESTITGEMDLVSLNITEEVSCSSLGMVPHDENKGLYNYEILLAEVRKGTKINVDSIYYLESTKDSSDESNLVHNIYLTGESKDASKLILLGGVYFNLNGSAVIENMSIECPTDSFSIFIDMNAPFINNITFRNNYVTGFARLVSSRMALDYDYEANPCRVESLVVENNEFYDIRGFTILLNDTPVTMATVRNNKVTNFSYTFYWNGITNSNPKQLYLIANSNAVIENNVVVCTDDYDAIARNNGKVERYYCFALIEGFSVECRGNTFEGIHFLDGAPTEQLYDNYFSVTKLLYENNIWKNNINFTPANTEYLHIQQSKIGHNVNGAKTERIYKNNTYIVEPDYADRFGKDRFYLKKQFNSYATTIDRVIIEDNYFDVYIMNFSSASQRFKELYEFKRNTVLMDTVDHNSYRQAFIKIDERGSTPRHYVFTNNKITSDTAAFGKGIGEYEYNLIFNYSSKDDQTVVDFNDNVINIPDFNFVPSEIEPHAGSDTVINFHNNVINGSSAQGGIQKVLRFYIDKLGYYINGGIQSMDTSPIIREERTLLPIRFVAEPLGAAVGWNGNEQKVTVSLKDKIIDLWIGKATAMVNGVSVPIDKSNSNVKPIVIPPGRTMLPLRFIAENLGCNVDWESASQMVTVTYPNNN